LLALAAAGLSKRGDRLESPRRAILCTLVDLLRVMKCVRM
jgi:hypothetical protein